MPGLAGVISQSVRVGAAFAMVMSALAAGPEAVPSFAMTDTDQVSSRCTIFFEM